MSAYQIQLNFERDNFGGPHARIVARDPLWQDGETMPIAPHCVSLGEVEYEVNRLKNALDGVLGEARRKFGARPG